MKQYHSVYSLRFPFVVVLLCCVLFSVDTTLGSSNHDDVSREEQDQGGRMIEVSSSSNGSSSDDSSRKTVTRKATKKNTVTPTSTPTPTLQMFLERYPEVNDRSEQAHLYMVYKLHVLGATLKELAKYETNEFNVWSCCKDDATTTGCHTNDDDTVDDHVDYCQADPTAKPAGINTECFTEGWGSSAICCQYWPDNHVGSKAWPWDKCV